MGNQQVGSHAELVAHPKLGASWEGFALEQILRGRRGGLFLRGPQRLRAGFVFPGQRHGVEIKHQDAPWLTRSMRVAMEDLQLRELLVVYPGNREYALAESVRAVPLTAVGGCFHVVRNERGRSSDAPGAISSAP